MPLTKRTGGAYDAARSKKHNHNQKSLSMLEKVELLKKWEKGTSVKTLCGIGSSKLQDLKKQKMQISNFFFWKQNPENFEILENIEMCQEFKISVLIKWFKLQHSKGVSISRKMHMEQTRVFHKELNLTYDSDL